MSNVPLPLFAGALMKAFKKGDVKKRPEGFALEDAIAYDTTWYQSPLGIIGFILNLLASILAVYLSWSANTMIDTNLLLKVLFAIFAFFGGWAYLLYYVLFGSAFVAILVKLM